MEYTKTHLLTKLLEAVSDEEWVYLENQNEKLVISQFNRKILLELREITETEKVELDEDKVSALYKVLKEYLQKYLSEKPEGWKWILIASIYLTFIAERPMHPIDLLGIRVSFADEKRIYECPCKEDNTESVCQYCVCKQLNLA